MFGNLYYGFNASFSNCTFTSNRAQFGGILEFLNAASSQIIFNFTDCVSIQNEASKTDTYIGAGVDVSQGGAFAILGYGEKTFLHLKNFFIGMSYAPTGKLF